MDEDLRKLRQQLELGVSRNYLSTVALLQKLQSSFNSLRIVDKVLGSREYNRMLGTVWSWLRSDAGRSLSDSGDKCGEKLQLHLSALDVLDVLVSKDADKFISKGIVNTDTVEYLFDFLELKKKHVGCCYGSMSTVWSESCTEKAYNLLKGRKLRMVQQVVSDVETAHRTDLYEVVLMFEDDKELVSEHFAKHDVCYTPHFRSYSDSKVNQAMNNSDPQSLFQVSYMVNPGMMWLQCENDKKDFLKIQRRLNSENIKLTQISESYSGKNAIVRIGLKSNFTFRAEILKLCKDDIYEVIAVDFGWTARVPMAWIYEIDDDLCDLIPIGMLCKLSDVIPRTNKHDLELKSIRLLRKLCQKPSLAKEALQRREHRIALLLSHLHHSRVFAKIDEILRIFAEVSVNPELAKECIDPITRHVNKFIECPALMRPVMQLFSNVYERVPNVAQILSKGRGTELIANIYIKHSTDDAIKAHFIEIMKKICQEYKLEVKDCSAEQDDLKYFNPPPVKSSDKTSTCSRELNVGVVLPRDQRPALTTAIVGTVGGKQDKETIGREICSFLNSKQGGTVKVGVSPDTGIITGLRYGKKERDEFRLLIDDILTDGELLRYGSSPTTKIRKENLKTSFTDLNNTFGARLRSGEEYQIAEVEVTPIGNDLVLFNEGKLVNGTNKVDDWVCYGRCADKGRKLLDFNDIRQYIAHLDRFFCPF